MDGRDQKFCERCDKPQATESDWQTFKEGEGDHLCWNSNLCVAVDWRARAIAAEESLKERVGSLSRQVFSLLSEIVLYGDINELPIAESEKSYDDEQSTRLHIAALLGLLEQGEAIPRQVGCHEHVAALEKLLSAESASGAFAEWKDWFRGKWTRELPQKPGIYAVVPLNCDEAELKGPGQVVVFESEGEFKCKPRWKGWFWSEPYPAMPPPRSQEVKT